MDIIHLLITLLVVAGAIFGGFWVVNKMELPQPWRIFALVFWGICCLVALLYLMFGTGDLGGFLHTKVIGLATVRALLA